MTTAARVRRACRVFRARRGRQVEAGPSRGQSMDVVAIAVTGASGLVGQRLLPRLADEAEVTRLIGLDVRDPLRRVRNLTFHRVDIGGAELKPLLEAADVLVHLATVVDPIPDEALMARVNVEGTRRVLDAAAAVGVRKVIRVSTAAVYGAWPNNPVPLTEDATLRPNPGFAPAVRAAGWRPNHTNEEAIIEGLDSLPPSSHAVRYIAAAALAATFGTAAGVLMRRRRKRAAGS